MNKKRILGSLLLIISILSSFSNLTLTGNVIGISYSSYFFLLSVFCFILGVVLIVMAKIGGLERRILSKKEWLHLTPKERAFKRKLVNLFDRQKPLSLNKIAYLLPRYDKVRKTGEYVSSHNYPIFLGRIGSREEYFSVDTRELVEFELGKRRLLLPTHIDIQERIGENHYRKIDKKEIEWDKLLKYSDDILNYFNRS